MADLIKDIAGAKYRVERCEDGLYQIPLRGDRGWIYEHGPETLGVHFRNTHKPTQTCNAVMAKIPQATIYVRGDCEAILLCPLAEAEKLLRVCGAKTTRKLSDEHKEILRRASRPFWIAPGSNAPEKAKKSTNATECECLPA